MKKFATVLLVAVLTLASCKKKEEAVAPPAAPSTAATTSAAPAAPKALAPIPSVALAADAPIPGNGLALWLTGDDAMKSATAGKVASWTNPLVPNVSASPTEGTAPPSVVANAINGHAAVRSDGSTNMLRTTIDISPVSWPDVYGDHGVQ